MVSMGAILRDIYSLKSSKINNQFHEIDPFFYLAFINQLGTKVSDCVFNQYLTPPSKTFISSKNMVAMGAINWEIYSHKNSKSRQSVDDTVVAI